MIFLTADNILIGSGRSGAKNSVGHLWDVLATWRESELNGYGRSLDCAHFLQEECPEETFEELQRFFGGV